MTAEYFTAEIPAKRTSLSISAKALERLKQEVGRVRSVGGSSGLLLGRKDSDRNNSESLTVTDCFPVATSESVQGPSANPELLTRARALWKQGPSRTLYAVGRYQVTSAESTRSTFGVRVQEFAPRDLYVQLNVQGSGGLAAFYVIENDRGFEDLPDFTVPIDSLAANATKPLDGAVHTRAPSSEAVHGSDETRLEAPRPFSKKFEWFGLRAPWIAVVLLAGIAAMILLRHGTVALFNPKLSREETPPRAMTLGLQPVRTGSQWVLHWDAQAPALKFAQSGLITISDGARIKQLKLDRSQLNSAQVVYVSESKDVSFRLEVYQGNGRGWSESVRTAPSGAMDQTGSKPQRGTSREVDSRGISAVALSANTARVVGLPAANADNLHNGTTSAVKSSVKEVPVPLVTQPTRIALNRVRAERRTPEGAVPSAFQNSARIAAIIGKRVPDRPVRIEQLKVVSPPATTDETETSRSQGGLVRESSSDRRILPRYVKPQPLQKPMPLLGSALYSRYAAGGVDVSVAVHIDATGHVTDARLKDVRHKTSSSLQNPPILENAALIAAQRWIFEPARLYGKAIESDYNIIFRFSDTGR